MISARTAVFGTYAYTFRYRIEVRLVPLDAGPQAYFHQPSRKLELPFFTTLAQHGQQNETSALTLSIHQFYAQMIYSTSTFLRDFVLRIIIIAPGNKIVDGLHNVLFSAKN
ncbi:unnamed protein product [Amoebophrya sp. A120]|nr:unnamed protein product [Amoebophrya sp. A120]|eukprot:GSA120T00010588001.1